MYRKQYDMDNARAGGAGMPRWVKAFIGAFFLLVIVVVVLHLTGNGFGGMHHHHADSTPSGAHG